LGIALNAIAGALFAVPVVGYIFGPARRKEMKKELAWITLGPLTQFPKAKPDSQTIAIRSCARGMAIPATFLAGCGGFRPTSCRSLRLTAPILAVLCGGIRNRDCSCARVTAAPIMPMAAAPRVHHLAVFFEYDYKLESGQLLIKSRSGTDAGIPAQPGLRRPTEEVRIAPDQRPRRLVCHRLQLGQPDQRR